MQHYGEQAGSALLAQIAQKAMLRSASARTAAWQSDHFGDVLVVDQNVSVAYGEKRTETWSKHIATRKVLVAAEFLKLPPTTSRNGLTGYYLSPTIGAWRGHLSGKYLAEALKPPAAVPNFIPRPKEQLVLTPWTEADLRRLGLSLDGSGCGTVVGTAPHGDGPVATVVIDKKSAFRGVRRR